VPIRFLSVSVTGKCQAVSIGKAAGNFALKKVSEYAVGFF